MKNYIFERIRDGFKPEADEIAVCELENAGFSIYYE